MSSSSNPFLSISIGGSIIGSLTFKLEDAILPKTCSNFRRLLDSKYKGVKFHRIIPGFIAQGGDFTSQNGTGGESIYGSKFADEKFNVVKHDVAGVLSMANSGPNSNGSQFFITLGRCSHLDGKHVAFGSVVTGFDLLEQIAKVDIDEKDCPVPLQKVEINDCGSSTAPDPTSKRTRSDSFSASSDGSESDSSSSSDSDSSDNQKKHKSDKKKHHHKKHKRSSKHKKKKEKKSKSKHRRKNHSSDYVSSDSEDTGKKKLKKSKKKSKKEKEEVRRSAITGKKIKMNIDKDEDDLARDRGRKELLQFMNSQY